MDEGEDLVDEVYDSRYCFSDRLTVSLTFFSLLSTFLLLAWVA